jgi:hypothetical protein
MLDLAIQIIILLAIIGVIVWFMTKVAIPAPISYVIYAVIAIVALILLASLGDGDVGHFRLFHSHG